MSLFLNSLSPFNQSASASFIRTNFSHRKVICSLPHCLSIPRRSFLPSRRLTSIACLGILASLGEPCDSLCTRLNTGDICLFSTYRLLSAGLLLSLSLSLSLSLPLSLLHTDSPSTSLSLFSFQENYSLHSLFKLFFHLFSFLLLCILAELGTRFITRSKWDHVGVIIVLNSIPMVLEVTNPCGVELTPASKRLHIYRYSVNEIQRKYFLKMYYFFPFS
jgi:hypothetical protein